MTDYFEEPSRTTPIACRCDVLVCGGGPAGVSAAIAAARSGADTVCLELSGCLGGVWTSGLLAYVLDAGNKGGLVREYVGALEEAGGKRRESDVDPESPISGLPWVAGSYVHDPETLKIVLEEMALTAGVRLRYHTRVVAAAVDGNRVDTAVSESKSGREGWKAKVFVDCTGDGDFAAAAGCGFDVGHPVTGEFQPMSMLGIVGGIRFDEVKGAVGLQRHTGGRSPDAILLDLIRKGGAEPSYGRPSLNRITDDLFFLMANHLSGFAATDANAVTAASIRGRKEFSDTVRALRSLGGPWAGIRTVATAAQVGIRESRRIHGLYTVKGDDLVSGAEFPDGVCRVNFPVDVHATDRGRGAGYDDAGIRSKPYDVPLRSLISRERENLMMAGRNISGDFYAHASYRVTGNAVMLGQAAGIAAVLAANTGVPPARVDWRRFEETSMRLFSR